MMPATKKPLLLQLPRSLKPEMGNRLWLDCANGWQRKGGKSRVIAPAGDFATDYARCGIQHTVLPTEHSVWPYWQKKRAITDVLSEASLAHIWFQDLAEWRFLRRYSLRHVQLLCLIDSPLPDNRFYRSMLNDYLLRGGALLTTSTALQQHLEQVFGVHADDVVVQLPAIDTNLFDPAQIKPDRALRLATAWRVPENATLLIHCGALQADGGQISLLHAMAQTGRRDIYAVILGTEKTPGYRDKLMGVMNHYGLAGQVLFTEYCHDLPAALWLAQAVVCASRNALGADPLLLAAQAMGRPVLVSDAPCHMELVEPGYSAWVYPAHDTEALHNAIMEVINLGERARTVHAHRVRTWVQARFPHDQWLAALLGETHALAAAVA